MFRGYSTSHSSTVGLVLNLTTGHISPQYHLVYDELFSTVFSSSLQEDALPHRVFVPEVWNKLIQSGYDRLECLEEVDGSGNMPALSEDWLTPAEIDTRQFLRESRLLRQQTRHLEESVDPPSNVCPVVKTSSPVRHNQDITPIPFHDFGDTPAPPTPAAVSPLRYPPSPHPLVPTPQLQGRGQRIWKQNPKFFDQVKWLNFQTGSDIKQKVPSSMFNSIYLQTLQLKNKWTAINSMD
jgi:hypothetical protein